MDDFGQGSRPILVENYLQGARPAGTGIRNLRSLPPYFGGGASPERRYLRYRRTKQKLGSYLSRLLARDPCQGDLEAKGEAFARPD